MAGILSMIVAVAIFAVVPMAGHAETRVTGNAQELNVESNDTVLEEVLATLGTSFNLHYRSTIDLNQSISGTYKGSLRQVVARLLAGYNFFLRDSSGAVEVVVVGLAGLKAAATVATAPVAATVAASEATNRGRASRATSR
jgi:hypothetical protein